MKSENNRRDRGIRTRVIDTRRWHTRFRIWMTITPADMGYLSYNAQTAEVVLTICNRYGRALREEHYRPIRKTRRVLLAIGAMTAWLRKAGKLVIDAGHDGLHAWLYVSPDGSLYLRIPSEGWSIGNEQRTFPTIWTAPYLPVWRPAPDPEARHHAARRRLSGN